MPPRLTTEPRNLSPTTGTNVSSHIRSNNASRTISPIFKTHAWPPLDPRSTEIRSNQTGTRNTTVLKRNNRTNDIFNEMQIFSCILFLFRIVYFNPLPIGNAPKSELQLTIHFLNSYLVILILIALVAFAANC